MVQRRTEDGDASTIAQRKYTPSPLPEATFTLTAVEGPDRGLSLRLDGSQASRVLVGQSPACDLRVTDREVSRRHAALEIVGHRLRLMDLGSKNGTTLNGTAMVEAFLEGGELLAMGGTVFRVERGEPPANLSLPSTTHFGRMLGWSREMRRLYPLCQKLADSTVPVVIEGETGVGKEVLAEALHEQGPRAAGPFIVFDCTAVPPNLVESELFGHERGAYTGAISSRNGVFVQASGGTLLIDEIGDLDSSLQPRLLRAIERGEVKRVGGDRAIRVDVRVLAATRRDLDRQVQAGTFRDDLFHRLAVGRIELPPLRERRGDIPLLAQQFCGELGGDPRTLTGELLSRWEDYAWPGNVRELRNTVTRLIALGELALEVPLRASEAPPPLAPDVDFMTTVLARRLSLPRARQQVIDEFERRYVQQVLDAHGGNVTQAAAASGIGRRYFHMLRSKTNKA